MTGCPPWPPDLRRPAGTTALLAATRKIPVVFMQVNDPVEQGFVASLAHPADNTTGFTQMSAELDPKRLQLLHDIAPSLSRAHLLSEPSSHAGSRGACCPGRGGGQDGPARQPEANLASPKAYIHAEPSRDDGPRRSRRALERSGERACRRRHDHGVGFLRSLRASIPARLGH